MFLPVLKNRDLRLLLPWLGLAMCCYVLLKWNDIGFPGWHALVPTLGTAVIIYAGGQKLKRNDILFFENLSKFRLAQFFGDISYSLYLYHWPLIILVPLFLGADLGQSGRWLKIVILIGSVTLAWLSYRFIETPTRKLKLSNSKIWLLGIGCLATIIVPAYLIQSHATHYIDNIYDIVYEKVTNPNEKCIGAKAIQNRDKCGNPFGRMDKQYMQFAEKSFMSTIDHSRQNEMTKLCQNSKHDAVDQFCEFGDKGATKIILMLGDSYSEQWYPAFDIIGRELHYKIIGANSISCAGGFTWLSVDVRAGYEQLERTAISCNERFDWVRNNLWPKAETVILASSPFSALAGQRQYAATMAQTIRELNVLYNLTPILIQSIPTLNSGSTHNKELQQKCTPSNNCTTPLYMQHEVNMLNTLYDNILVQDSNLRLEYLSIEDLFCDQESCYSQIGGLPVYYDEGHINALYVASSYEYISSQLQKAIR